MLGATSGNTSAIAAAVLKTFRLIISNSNFLGMAHNHFRGWTFSYPRTDRAPKEPVAPELYAK
jgi:hypothetical protein